MAPTLIGRLLCASGCAYDIAPGGCAYTADLIYSPGVNFTSGPTAICGGALSVNACLVGKNADGIIVAFRGTLPPAFNDPAERFRDWLQDFFEAPKTCNNGPGRVPGSVHSGFYDATMSVIDGVAAAVKNLGPDAVTPVYVTGHSKGGAMASIGAYLLNQTYGIPIQQVVTFASAKPGDPGFQMGYQSVIHNQIRYENYGDIVPLLPPGTTFTGWAAKFVSLIPRVGPEIAGWFRDAEQWDYEPVGTMQFIESASDKYQIISNEPFVAQVWDVVKELSRLDLNGIADAHRLSCGYGYMSGVCPTGVCP